LSNTFKGIILTLIAIAIFCGLDASAKKVMETLPGSVSVFFRYLIALAFSLPFVFRVTGLAIPRTDHLNLHVMRGSMLLLSTACNFVALVNLQLAQTSAILFTIPLWTCALSMPLLGEHVGIRRWTAVVVGFLGVLIIMQPWSASFHWAMIFSVGAALAGALYNIITRKVGKYDRAETSLFYVCLFGAVISASPLPLTWQTPQGFDWVLLVTMGLCGALGHLLLIQAHRLTTAATLAPLIYTQIIWMILIGYFTFGDVPDRWTLSGAAIVILSGLFVFAREKKLGRETITPAPAD
jgi:drug/metabolite transporter (DMT)-like permease